MSKSEHDAKTVCLKAPKLPRLSKVPTQPTASPDSDEFQEYWRKKADHLRNRFDDNLCLRTLDTHIKPMAMRVIQGYCDAMEELERHLAEKEVVSVDYRIAALHSILTAINTIQADLSGLDEP